jgi:hypothetical protein
VGAIKEQETRSTPKSDFCEMPTIIQFSSGEYLQALHSHGVGAQYWSELLLITSEIYEAEKVERTLFHTLFHNIYRDLDTALRQAEHSPGKSCALSSPTGVKSLIRHVLPQVRTAPSTQDKLIFLQILLNVLDQ